MGFAKQFLEKVTGGKKLQKDQCLILVLAGILLCVIALPAGDKTVKSNVSDRSDAILGNHTDNGAEGTMEEDAAAAWTDTADGGSTAYTDYWERQLEDALRCVDGVGQVRVLMTLRESEHRIVEKDGPEQYTDTDEADSAGGSRTVKESSMEKATVYTVDGNGQSVPYVVKTIPPAVEGVVVIAQGAQSTAVQEDIIEAIQVLFDIDMNKIKIVKMKNNQ